jgi:guanylate kinase
MADPGKIFVVSGPAGVGKTTVCQRLLEYFPGRLKRIVTATTRPPRPGEIDGVDYCFIDEATFLKYIAEDKFLEYSSVHRKYFYGSPIASVLSHIRHGTDALLIIDVHGIAKIRKHFRHLLAHIVSIFIMPENLAVLESRLQLRGSESAESLAGRLKSAQHEIKLAKNYDYIVISGTKAEDLTSMAEIYRIEQSATESAAASLLRFIYHPKQSLMLRV